MTTRDSGPDSVIRAIATAKPTTPPVEIPTLGDRYVIKSEIGRGGMGRVFLAHDQRLGRDVAIKVLAHGATSEAAMQRFEQEARATALLEHPNIVVVHDIGAVAGVPFIVSELLQGETLRHRLSRPIPTSEALVWGGHIASALSAAHDRGIVHRDLKPENLFITNQGRVKILDFGVAKLTQIGEGALPLAETDPGTVIGTAGYMSPEQVRGEAVDARSDLFSFGLILYEMLSSKRAFRGRNAVETNYAILNLEPESLPPRVPPTAKAVVSRCIRKEPGERFQSAKELAAALNSSEPARVSEANAARIAWLGITVALVAVAFGLYLLTRRSGQRATTDSNSIAVLPFVNMSGNPENEYFSDGITEELTNALANVEGLRVSSRTSAFVFKGKKLGVREIGEELHIATVVEGSVRREGNSVRVTAQLVNARDGSHLWSKTYDRELTSVFSLEDELARSIARALTLELGAHESTPLVRQKTASTAAHDDYLRGRHLWNQLTPEALRKAIAFFKQAIAEDPNYALAYAGLADSYALLIFHDPAHRGSNYRLMKLIAEQLPQSKAAALRALQLDDTLAEAHAALGLISYFETDASGGSSVAEREFRRAIELDPRYATAHHWYAWLLDSTGRPAEARKEIDLARQLDSTSPIINTDSAMLHNLDYEYPQAIDDANRALELDSHFALARLSLAVSYSRTFKYKEALAELEAAARDEPSRRDHVRSVLAELAARAGQSISPVALAAVYLALGDTDMAFGWLDNACRDRDPHLATLRVEPLWTPLRSDARFARLLACVEQYEAH